MAKQFGAVYTPEGYARILTNWAIRSKTDIVLDMGIGPGVFVFQAYERLMNLGARSADACNQIFGSEINKQVFDIFTQDAANTGLVFPNLQNIDFFDSNVIKVNAIVGNPPYVRRRELQRISIDKVRKKTLKRNPALQETELSNLTDLYVYFILAALPALKPEGRFAAIVADTWLDAKYGFPLKKYLLDELEIEQVIGLDRRVFNDVQVKTVLILATKKNKSNYDELLIKFVRVKNGLLINSLTSLVLEERMNSSEDITIGEVASSSLDYKSPWGVYFKTTTLFEEIRRKKIISPIRKIANIKIGLQTLAKEFFVLSCDEKENGIVEEKYLAPFAYSVSNFDKSVINGEDPPSHYIFYCSDSKDDLFNTKALKYIVEGETTEVPVRGKGTTVIGYHNKERIKRAHRLHWYDVKSWVQKRPVADILLPRFIYKKYTVLWNAAGYIPGGAVIQFLPKQDLFTKAIDIKVYLAILTSSYSEIVFRIYSHVYGGGSFNLSITTIRDAPTIDVTILSSDQKEKLVAAYDDFLGTDDKWKIDHVVYSILELDHGEITAMGRLLVDLRGMSESARKAAVLAT